MEFLRTFLRRRFVGKPVVAYQTVDCFLKLLKTSLYRVRFTISTKQSKKENQELNDKIGKLQGVNCQPNQETNIERLTRRRHDFLILL